MSAAIIFDMDGVLVDSGPPHLESWRRLALQHDIAITPDRFRQTFGQTSRDIIRSLWGADLSADEVRQLDDQKESIYRDLIRDRVPLMPGCREMLDRLQAVPALAVVPGARRARARRTCRFPTSCQVPGSLGGLADRITTRGSDSRPMTRAREDWSTS